MRKSIVLLVVGAFLIIVAFGTASSIPLEANKDFNRLISKSRLDWSTKESEYIYMCREANIAGCFRISTSEHQGSSAYLQDFLHFQIRIRMMLNLTPCD